LPGIKPVSETTMKAKVDHSKCQSHFVCNLIAPKIFVMDDSSLYPITPKDDLTKEQLSDAQQAAVTCPEGAITIE
jgi:ferredoxin